MKSFYGYKISNKIFYALIVLFLLILINIYRVLKALIFSDTNDERSIEEIKQSSFYYANLESISRVSYLIFFSILLHININQTKSKSIMFLISIILITIIILPVFPLLTFINLALYFMCNNKPIIDEKDMDKEFENNKQFEDKYNEIRSEFDSYVKKEDIRCFRETNQLLNNIDTLDKKNDYCWRTLYLKMGGIIDEKMKKEFPETVKLLESDQIYNAFFSILDPKIDIKPHYGYYKGYLRYHLGLIIPEENGERPYLTCGDEVYYWKEGKGVIFDDMFLHYVRNPTNKTRVVLYLDIKRNNLDPVTKNIVDIGNMLIDATPLTRLMINKQHKQSKLI